MLSSSAKVSLFWYIKIMSECMAIPEVICKCTTCFSTEHIIRIPTSDPV